MEDIKLFVSCHKEFYVPSHPFLVPIQVGTALADRCFKNYVHDNKGRNISEKNCS